jgi:hypothetical protein
MHQRINDALWLLSRRSVVEIDERFTVDFLVKRRELRAQCIYIER